MPHCPPVMGVTWKAAPPKLTITHCPKTQMINMTMKNLLARILVKILSLLSIRRQLFKKK
jgi:hypothetical protein